MSVSATVLDNLAQSPLFQRLARDDIAEMLGVCTRQSIKAGDMFCQAGDAGDTLGIVEEGQVEVFVLVPGGKRTLLELGPGGVFGEMSFLDGSQRSASVQATVDTTLLSLSAPSFAGYTVSNPHVTSRFNHNLARVLAERLRTTTAQLKEAVDHPVRLTGMLSLGLPALVDSGTLLEITLLQLGTLRARLTQVTHSEAGAQLVLVEESGAEWLVPYGAVLALRAAPLAVPKPARRGARRPPAKKKAAARRGRR